MLARVIDLRLDAQTACAQLEDQAKVVKDCEVQSGEHLADTLKIAAVTGTLQPHDFTRRLLMHA
eukprot:5310573-Alexandrium_andersonii.AAC.1